MALGRLTIFNLRGACMLIGRLNKIALVIFLAVFVLAFSNYQAYFYSDAMLKKRAAEESGAALIDRHCDELSFIGEEADPPGGVRVFTWRCLSKTSDSIDLSILIEGDGYPRRYSERLTCTPELTRQGFNCEPSSGTFRPAKG